MNFIVKLERILLKHLLKVEHHIRYQTASVLSEQFAKEIGADKNKVFFVTTCKYNRTEKHNNKGKLVCLQGSSD